MHRRTLRLAIAGIVAVALLGGVAAVSGDDGGADVDALEWMHDHAPGGHLGDHAPGEHHGGHAPGDHHQNHSPSEHHETHGPDEHHADHDPGECH